MPNSRSISTYDDVKAVLDAAINHGLPAQYELATPAAAIRWRSRANSFRKLSSVSAYKGLVFSIGRETPNTVTIMMHEVGQLKTLDGTPLEVGPAAPLLTDAEQFAQELAAELGIK